MSRQSLPKIQSDKSETTFFPSLQREMNLLFDQFRTGIPLSDVANHSVFGASVFPAIDVIDTSDAMEISAEVPGLKEEDLDVSISGDVLTLKGEKSSDHEKKEDSYHLIERKYGSFRRQIPLGFSPESGAVDVNFNDGILKLSIKKPATAKPEVQKIDIKKS